MAKVAVVGAGGMGSVVAAFLARSGVETVLVGRSAEHVDAINEKGLLLRGPDGGGEIINLRASTRPDEVGIVDHLIVLTKAFDTSAAARTAAAMTGLSTWITTLQNGLGNDLVLAEVLEPHRVNPGTTTIGGQRHEPGVASVSESTAAGRSLTQVGAPQVPGGSLDGARELAAMLSSAGLPTLALEPVEFAMAMWAKLALAVMGPVSAMARATVIETWQNPDTRELVKGMHDEVVLVARAQGVDLDPDGSWTHAMSVYQGTGPHFTSMATDVIEGRRTEIDAITGDVVRRGIAAGVAMPTSAAVVALIRATYDIAAIRTNS